jgi:hypothetical protein
MRIKNNQFREVNNDGCNYKMEEHHQKRTIQFIFYFYNPSYSIDITITRKKDPKKIQQQQEDCLSGVLPKKIMRLKIVYG